jgi:superfamily I DNA/RNA helicase
LNQKRNASSHVIIKASNAQDKERILTVVRDKGQAIYKDRPNKIIPDFSTEIPKSRSWANVIQTLKEYKCQPRLLYPAKFSITIDGENKVFQYKTKFKQCFHKSSPISDNRKKPPTQRRKLLLLFLECSFFFHFSFSRQAFSW